MFVSDPAREDALCRIDSDRCSNRSRETHAAEEYSQLAYCLVSSVVDAQSQLVQPHASGTQITGGKFRYIVMIEK